MKARAALLVAAGLLLAGCGIPTTGVVEAGEPAVGVHQTVTVYFVRLQDGALATMTRMTETEADMDVVVGLLLNGVAPTEQQLLGLTSDLPAGTTAPAVRTQDGTVTVDLRISPKQLSGTAVDQVVCTVLANSGTVSPGARPAKVTVTADGVPVAGLRGGRPCPTGDEAMPFRPGEPAVPSAGGVSGG